VKKHLITYGDKKYAQSVQRIKQEAASLNVFDEIVAYSLADLGEDILQCEAIQHERGGGYWSWKPYIIWLTLQKMDEGDIVVYCDAGCTLNKSKEWSKWFNVLNTHDIIALLIHQRNENYCRKNVLDYFKTNPGNWEKAYMASATTITAKKNERALHFFEAWKNIMLNHPELVLDVPNEEKHLERANFVENRHDQSVFSGLIYMHKNTMPVYMQWENYVNASLSKRAIVATRISDIGCRSSTKIPEYLKYYAKKILDVIYYSPVQWWWGK
jgi:hypothetical protein